jgi:GNAT superfamily N-acetyltransferase
MTRPRSLLLGNDGVSASSSDTNAHRIRTNPLETPLGPSVYRTYDLPPLVKCQIPSFMRIEWTQGYAGEQQFRDEVWPEGEEQNTVHFVLKERGFVISQAGVVWKRIEHDGETYETGGLTGVLTFPDFRRRGYGTQVVEAATRYIVDKGVDIGLTTSHLRWPHNLTPTVASQPHTYGGLTTSHLRWPHNLTPTVILT